MSEGPNASQADLLNDIERAGYVFSTYNGAGNVEYRLSSGRRLTESFIGKAISRGWLKPRDPGLYPGFTQSWEVAE